MTSTSSHRLPGAPVVPLGELDLARHGYVVEEHLVSGVATSYRSVGGEAPHGRWSARPAVRAPFTTRVVVVRPEEPARFDGTVLLEWMNVSGGVDVPTEWLYLHRQLLRTGAAWVGVSAQRAGIDGGGLLSGPHLRKVAPARYSDLQHPGDAWSFDIFTAVAELVRRPDNPLLSGLEPELLLATGESQSAIYLLTYVNAVDPLVRAVDGVLLHGRPARGAWVDGTLLDLPRLLREGMLRPSLTGHRVRDDARIPVLTLQSETDLVVLGGVWARQPDAHHHRTWEVAGAAHFDTYGLTAGYADDGTLSAGELHRLMAPVRDPRGHRTTALVNSGPQQRYALAAAFEALRGWVRTGTAPPSAPTLRTRPLQPLRLVRDEWGIACGGVRSPWVDAPLAVLSGTGQRRPGVGLLFGSTRPFDAVQRRRAYPLGRGDYLERFAAAAVNAVDCGQLLAADLDEVLGLGEAAWQPGDRQALRKR